MTGDLGFLRRGHLHVVGRKKDIVIVRGENVHPADVEAAALEAHAAIVPGGLAAVGIDVDGTQQLVVLVEVNRKALSGPQETSGLRRRVSERVARRVGHVPARVVVLRPGSLPRTSSGKIRRFEAAALLRSGALAAIERAFPAGELASPG
jgi:acyl-CoA synthetase (AMP-forming)/AMP-acid ligase II